MRSPIASPDPVGAAPPVTPEPRLTCRRCHGEREIEEYIPGPWDPYEPWTGRSIYHTCGACMGRGWHAARCIGCRATLDPDEDMWWLSDSEPICCACERAASSRSAAAGFARGTVPRCPCGSGEPVPTEWPFCRACDSHAVDVGPSGRDRSARA